MAWTSKTFTALDNKPTWEDLNKLKADIGAWGDDVNAGTHNLSNLGVLTFAAGGYITGASRVEASGFVRAMSSSLGAITGTSTELGYTSVGDYGFLQAYNRTGSAFKSLRIDALSLLLNAGSGGSVGIRTDSPTAVLHVVGLANYANNAAAAAAGLTAGAFYIVTGTNPAQVAIVT